MNTHFSTRDTSISIISPLRTISEGTLILTVMSDGNKSSISKRTSNSSCRHFSRHLKEIGMGDTVVLEFGGDVCAHMWSEISDSPHKNHLPLLSLQEFRNSYLSLIRCVKSMLAVPVLVSLPPVSPKKYFDNISKDLDRVNIYRWMGWNIQTLTEIQEQYNNALLSLAREEKVLVVDVSDLLAELDCLEDCYEDDGCHLNHKGRLVLEQAVSSMRL